MSHEDEEKKYTEADLRDARARERYHAELKRIDGGRDNIFGVVLIVTILLVALAGGGFVVSGLAGVAVGWGLSRWYHAVEVKKLG